VYKKPIVAFEGNELIGFTLFDMRLENITIAFCSIVCVFKYLLPYFKGGHDGFFTNWYGANSGPHGGSG